MCHKNRKIGIDKDIDSGVKENKIWIGLEVRRMCLKNERRIRIEKDNDSGAIEEKRDPCAL